MRYIGGKHRQGPTIARYVQPHLTAGRPYIEPFCGAMGSACRVAEASTILPAKPEFVLSDNNLALINMWHACMGGWLPPPVITEEFYDQLKHGPRDPADPLTAAVGFGMAFAGKFFATFARDPRGKIEFARNLRNLLAKRVDMMLKAGITASDIFCAEYQAYADTVGAVFYLDPPYANRTGQTNAAFNSVEFWEFARRLSERNVVFITEFVAPDDFVPVHNFGDTVVRHHQGKGSDGTSECIFIRKDKDFAKHIERPVGTMASAADGRSVTPPTSPKIDAALLAEMKADRLTLAGAGEPVEE